MKHSLNFGGINSADYGVWITGNGTFSAPERDVEFVSVPGRNGDLLIDNGRWNNIDVTYPANIPFDFDAKISSFREALCRKRGYQRLEDTYHLDEFRMGAFTMGLQPETIPRNRGGDFNIVFNCKPQRFLKSGEMPLTFMPVRSLAFISQYIPVYYDGSHTTEVRYTTHFPGDDTLELHFATYDSNGDEIFDTVLSVGAGDTHYAYLDDEAYWRIWLEDVEDVHNTWIELSFPISYGGKVIHINAIMGRYFTIYNPTGYVAKPLIECYGDMLPYTDFDNYTGDQFTFGYSFRTDSTGKTHFFMDCDVQYLYDDVGNNLTNKLVLTTTGSDPAHGLVFPQLGEERTEIEMTYVTSTLGDGMGIINIYPRWWRL